MLDRAMKKTIFETQAERRGRLAAEQAGEYVFTDVGDYVSMMASQVRRSSDKYSHIAKAGSMSGTTVSNLASGKTHYPRFSTMFGVADALGLEVTFRPRGRSK
jgi:DNA-binding phage protein